MILITGAAGKTGRALIQALCTDRVSVRAFVRRRAQIEPLRALGATEVIPGDLRNSEDLARACHGVDAIYHICPNMLADEVAIATSVIDAAQKAGVSRFVYHSVLHPQTEAMPHHWQKLRVEELLFATTLDYTILQPAAYMQNVLTSWQSIVETGIYRVPYRTTTNLGMIDLHDVAEVAAHVLISAGHSGATYELASDEWLTQDEVAAILSALLASPVHAEMQSRAQWQQQAQQAGLSTYAVETLLKMFDYYEQYGFGGNGNVTRWLLGRKPTSFAECMQRYC